MKELTKTMKAKHPQAFSSEQPIDLTEYDCSICKDKTLIFSKVNSGIRPNPKAEKVFDPDFPEGFEILAAEWGPPTVNPENAHLWESMAKQCFCVELKRKQREMDRIMATSNLSPRFKKRRFDTIAWLDPRDFNQRDVPEVEQLMSDQRKAYDTVLNYCINFETHQKLGQGFGLFGDGGTAKTHLLAAAVNYLLERKIQAVHVNTLEILEEIKATYETDEFGKPTKEIRASEIVNLIKTCEYLSFDDVGTEKSTDWVREKFYEIINHRYENEMPTVFSTNYTIEELQIHLGRSYRRLIEPCLGRMAVIKGTSYEQLIIRKKR